MDTQSEIAPKPVAESAQWAERATEARSMAGKANDLEVWVMLEHIATLYEALSKRLSNS